MPSNRYRPVVIVLVLLAIAGCHKAEKPLPAERVAEYNAVFAGAKWTAETQKKWARSCALCHVAGQGGAPRLGHPDEWAPRLEQGKALLLAHTLDGYNKMPPLGYCMDCEMSDFAAMINMMSGDKR